MKFQFLCIFKQNWTTEYPQICLFIAPITVSHQSLRAADVKWYPISQIIWWCTSPEKSELHPSLMHKPVLAKFIKTRLNKQLDKEKRKLPSARREFPLEIQNLQLEIHLFTTCAKLKIFNTSAELHLELFFFLWKSYVWFKFIYLRGCPVKSSTKYLLLEFECNMLLCFICFSSTEVGLITIFYYYYYYCRE